MIVTGNFCVWSFVVHSLPLLELSEYENLFICHVWVIIPSMLIWWLEKSSLWSYSTISESNVKRSASVLHFYSISIQNCKRQMFQRFLVQDRSPENDTFHTFDNIPWPIFVKRLCHVITTKSIQRLTILFIAEAVILMDTFGIEVVLRSRSSSQNCIKHNSMIDFMFAICRVNLIQHVITLFLVDFIYVCEWV